MNSIQRNSALVISVGLLFTIAPFAYAAVSVAGDGNVEIEVGDDRKGSDIEIKNTDEVQVNGIRIEGGVNTAGNVKMEDGRDDTPDTERREQERVQASTSVRGLENAEMHASENGLLGIENAQFHIELQDDNSKDEGETVLVRSAEQVRTEAEFRQFVSFKAKEDAHLKQVDVEKGKVTVEYTQPAKLFGFISTSLTAKASADVQGEVTVSYPWYHVFMHKVHSSTALRVKIANVIEGTQKEVMATTTTQAEVQTRLSTPDLFEMIVNTLRTNVSADAAVSAGQ
jgi:hypothetical protein